jgi:hypothetical protein
VSGATAVLRRFSPAVNPASRLQPGTYRSERQHEIRVTREVPELNRGRSAHKSGDSMSALHWLAIGNGLRCSCAHGCFTRFRPGGLS